MEELPPAPPFRDGYLKYYSLGEKNPGLIEERRKVYADYIRKYLLG